MKHYIRGVGSGLPIVKEYLDFSHGTISIEDNLGTGAVVTISLKSNEEPAAASAQESPYDLRRPAMGGKGGRAPQPAMPPLPPLSQRERDFLPIFLSEGALGVTDLARLTGVPQSSTYVTLSKLEEAGLIEKTAGQKRILTDLGFHVANSL